MRSGDKIVLFDGYGLEFPGTLHSVERKSVTVDLDAGHDPQTESSLQITLWHGVCRGERMDYVIQKATELGVCRIKPVFTARGVVRLDEKRAGKRADHWGKVAIAAAEQSGRVCVPVIDQPVPLSDALTGAQPGLSLMLEPQAEDCMESISIKQSLTLLTGPEGGFTPEERNLALEYGFRLVRMGPRILRSETAPVAAISVLQNRFGDLN